MRVDRPTKTLTTQIQEDTELNEEVPTAMLDMKGESKR